MKPEVIISDWSSVEQFLEAHPLGLLTTAIPLAGQSTLQASHLPFLFDPPHERPSPSEQATALNSTAGTWNFSSSSNLGTLRCHLARSNPQAKALLSLPPDSTEEVLVVFSDSANVEGYISPQWYVDTKPKTGKVVPTWNYSELQLYGTVRVLPSPREIVEGLTNKHEARYAEKVGKEGTWKVSDAPEKYVELLERTIIGVEVKVSKVGYKVKMSRDKSEGDRKGVVEGLRGIGAPGTEELAELVERSGPIKKEAS